MSICYICIYGVCFTYVNLKAICIPLFLRGNSKADFQERIMGLSNSKNDGANKPEPKHDKKPPSQSEQLAGKVKQQTNDALKKK
jgi:hypothetical protein